MDSQVVSTPLTRPTAAPVRRATTAPTSQTSPTFCMASAPTTPASAMVEPTERSNSPETMTSVMPTAMIDTSVVCRPILAKFSAVRNTGDAMAKTAISTAKPTNSRPPDDVMDLMKALDGADGALAT